MSGGSRLHSQIRRRTQRQPAVPASPHRQKPKARLVRSCVPLAPFRLGSTTSHGDCSCSDSHANVGSRSRQRRVRPLGRSPCHVLASGSASTPLPDSRTPANKQGHPATTKAPPPSSIACETEPWIPRLSDAAGVRSAPPPHAPSSFPAPAIETRSSPRAYPPVAPPQTTARPLAESPQTCRSDTAPLSPLDSQTKSTP
jgi:hypothetical protein